MLNIKTHKPSYEVRSSNVPNSLYDDTLVLHLLTTQLHAAFKFSSCSRGMIYAADPYVNIHNFALRLTPTTTFKWETAKQSQFLHGPDLDSMQIVMGLPRI